MLNAELFTEILSKFEFGVENIQVQSLHAIKRATIELLRNALDPEAVFLGTLVTDIQKINNVNIARFALEVNAGHLVLEVNPYWVCYLEKLGISYVARELRHELTHIVLMHPENIKLYSDKLQHCAVSIGMNICVNEYLNKLSAMHNANPPCPACMRQKYGNKIAVDVTGLQNMADANCPICFGTGDLDISMHKVGKIYKKYGGSISRPYHTSAFDYKGFAKAIVSAVPSGALSEDNHPNIYDLAESMLEYKDNYSKAVVNSLVHHALSQATGFNKSDSPGSLLDLLKTMRREKGVPYLLQIKGVLGASMRDESTATRFRPNRRFGYEYPGSKSVPKQRYVFAIDTSGSLPLDELKKMLNEFLNIRAYSDKIECRIIFFHHNVYYDKEVLDYKDSDLSKMESGGTDFDKVLQAVYLDKDSKECGDAVLMIYTDGYCSINTSRNKIGRSVYWLLTPDGDTGYIRKWDRDARIIRVIKEQDSGTDIFE